MANDASYQAKVYRKQGGNTLAIASGGTVDFESGSVLSYGDVGQVGDITWAITSTSGAYSKQISITLTDGAGAAIEGVRLVPLVFFADVGGAAFAAETSVGTLSTGQGAMTCSVAYPAGTTDQFHQCHAYAMSSTAGDLSLIWTDTGKTARYIGAVLSNGFIDISTAAITTTS